MIYRVLAELTMLVHFLFVAFVVTGGLLLLWRRAVAWVHVPLTLYAVGIEFFHWTCPLTPLEQQLRRLAGQAGYSGGFLQHYLGRILYFQEWGAIHTLLGTSLLVGNVLIYWWILGRGHGPGAGSPGG